MRSKLSLVPKELAAAQRRIDKWRAGNGRRRLIPEPVWAEAVKLATAHGVHRVSKCMRLSYEKLKERVEAGSATRERSRSRRSRAKPSTAKARAAAVSPFVELGRPALVAGGISVELSDGSGRCVTIRGAGHSEVLSIIATFCGQASAP